MICAIVHENAVLAVLEGLDEQMAIDKYRWCIGDDLCDLILQKFGRDAIKAIDITAEVKHLPDFRRAHNVTQAELAHELGVNQSTISDWENHVAKPKWRHYTHLASWILTLKSSFHNQEPIMPVKNTKAHHIAELFNHDGRNMSWESHTLEEICALNAVKTQARQHKIRYEFGDGSAIVTNGVVWEIEGNKPFTYETNQKDTVKCHFCKMTYYAEDTEACGDPNNPDYHVCKSCRHKTPDQVNNKTTRT